MRNSASTRLYYGACPLDPSVVRCLALDPSTPSSVLGSPRLVAVLPASRVLNTAVDAVRTVLYAASAQPLVFMATLMAILLSPCLTSESILSRWLRIVCLGTCFVGQVCRVSITLDFEELYTLAPHSLLAP